MNPHVLRKDSGNRCQVRRFLVCHLTSVHKRHDTRIFLKECRSLAKAGYEVHLVVGDGLGDCEIERIFLHDVGPPPPLRLKRMFFQPKKIMKKVLSLNPDIVHFHDPELLPIGVKLARKGFFVFFDSHEDVPRQHLARHYIPRFFRRTLSVLYEIYENHAARKLTGVVAATPHIKKRFSMIGIKTVNVNNFPIPEEFFLPEKKPSGNNRLCYIGVISRTRGLKQVIEALPLIPGAHLTLCGNFDEENFFEELKKMPGWKQVDYLGYVDREKMKEVMSGSSAGLVTLLPTPSYIVSLPVKMFEYMSAELPVIASDFPLWRKIIEKNGCGLCVSPQSPPQIAQAIKQILKSPEKSKEMGRLGRKAVLREYNWPNEAKKLCDFYEAFFHPSSKNVIR